MISFRRFVFFDAEMKMKNFSVARISPD